MSMPMTLPNPSHSGQAPSGLLKLYSLGSGSGYSSPQSSQAISVLKARRRQTRPSMSEAEWAAWGEGRGARGEGFSLLAASHAPSPLAASHATSPLAASHSSTNTKQRPRPLTKAVSNESRTRSSVVLPATSRRRWDREAARRSPGPCCCAISPGQDPAPDELVLRVTACAVCRRPADLRGGPAGAPPAGRAGPPGRGERGGGRLRGAWLDGGGARGVPAGSRRRAATAVPAAPGGRTSAPTPASPVSTATAGTRSGSRCAPTSPSACPMASRTLPSGAAALRRRDRLPVAAALRYRARGPTRPVRVRGICAAGPPGGAPLGIFRRCTRGVPRRCCKKRERERERKAQSPLPEPRALGGPGSRMRRSSRCWRCR